MKKAVIIITGVLLIHTGFAQNITVQQYIQEHKDFAIREMKRMGVPAAITLAQGILETQSGNSDLVKKSNNHFGIKCKSTWTATGVSHDDDALGECFRSYKDAEGSYRDHSNFLRGNERYAFLFRLQAKDYKAWAYGLKKAGYATNPNYPMILIKNIEDNNLQQYTMEGADEVPFFDASKYTSDPEDKAFDELTKPNSPENTVINFPISNDSEQQFENRFTINGATAINAKKGTSLLAIATENNIKLLKLLEYNDLEADGLLDKDQVIFLEKKSDKGEKDFYILKDKETLYDVAQKNGIRLQSLYEYNSLLKNDIINGGAKIMFKPGVEKSLTPENEELSTSIAKMHAVQPKEGLFSISKKYGITVTQIREWNNLPDDNLKVGQQLIVSVSK